MSFIKRGRSSKRLQNDLEKSIFFGKTGAVVKLLDQGADVNIPNDKLDTPIHIAAAAGNVKLAVILLGRMAEVNVVNQFGDTPLINACMNEESEMIKLLMEAGSDPKIKNHKGEVCISLDRKTIFLTFQQVAVDFLKLSLKKLVLTKEELAELVNPADEEAGDTRLHKAAYWGKVTQLKKLLHIGADIECLNNFNETPLHLAVTGENYKVVQTLLKANANIDAQNSRGETPLHIAAKKAHDVLIPLLMEYLPDMDLKDNEGKTSKEYSKTKKARKYLLREATPVNLIPKAKTAGNYKLGKTLGVGGFGKVKLAWHIETLEQVAIKIIQKSLLEKNIESKERLKREIGIMKVLNHPNVIKFKESFESPKNIYVVMEFVDGQELFDFIISMESIPEEIARNIFRQIVSGLSYCHRMHIIHRDLKPENVMVNAETLEAKIIDFGLSNVNIESIYQTSCGSPHYAAPEMLAGRSYGTALDIWSLGIVLYAMLFGHLPFEDDTDQNLIRNIFEMDKRLAFPPGASREVMHLIKRMLAVHPENRITISDIRRHPWVRLPNEHVYSLPKDHEPLPEVLTVMKQELDFDPDEVVRSVKNRRKSSIALIYTELAKTYSPPAKNIQS